MPQRRTGNNLRLNIAASAVREIPQDALGVVLQTSADPTKAFMEVFPNGERGNREECHQADEQEQDEQAHQPRYRHRVLRRRRHVNGTDDSGPGGGT
jgi:hypothetical protein